MACTCTAVGSAPSGAAIASLRQSSNYQEDHFINGMAAQDPPFFKATIEWIKGAKHTAPDGPIPVELRDKDDFASLPQSGLRITWLGHSTSLIEIDGSRFLVDPIWSARSSPFSRTGPKRFHETPISIENLPPIDAVLISHDHYDHLDMTTVIKLGQMGYRFVVPLGVGARLQGWDIPESQIKELDWWQSTRVGDVTITATPARHFSGRSLLMLDRNKTQWAGFTWVGPTHRVYYSGDTGMFPELSEIGERLGPFDVSLIEIGAYNQMWADLHLGPEQAVEAAKLVGSRLLVPVHWATFDLALHSWIEPAERVIVAAANQDMPLAIPKPGQSVEPSNPPSLVCWWPELPWQTQEEHPVVSSGFTSP